MKRNRHYTGTPDELNALSNIILIENNLDEVIDAAYRYARTIMAEGSRNAVFNALDRLAEQTSTEFTLPADMPGYEVAKYSNAAPIRRLRNMVSGLARWKAKAGQLVDA